MHELKELVFVNCEINAEKCKKLADNLIKMKKLKIFKMNGQKMLDNGISSIISNLAFNSSLKLVDIGEIAAITTN